MDADERDTLVGDGPRVSGRMRLAEMAARIAKMLERRASERPPRPEDEDDAEPLSLEPDGPRSVH